LRGSGKTYTIVEQIAKKLNTTHAVSKEILRVSFSRTARIYTVRDYKSIKFSNEWTLWFVEGDLETWVLQHSCGDAIAHDHPDKICKGCGTPVPKKDLNTVQFVLKKDVVKL